MELFTLLAKLTLDRKQYDQEISRIQTTEVELADATLGLDKDDFDSGIEEAEETEVGGKNTDLDLDKEPFDQGIEEADAEEVEDKDTTLSLDHGEFDEGIADAEAGAETLGESVGSIFSEIKGAIASAGIIALLSQLTNLITGAVRETAQHGDQIDKNSHAMGISTATYQRFAHALNLSGGSVTELSRGMMTFQGIVSSTNKVTKEEEDALKSMGIALWNESEGRAKTREELKAEATERLAALQTTEEHQQAIAALNSLLSEQTDLTEDQRDAFNKLNISLEDENGQMKSAEQLMQESIAAIAGLDNATDDEKGALVKALFGRNTTGLRNLIAAGAEGVQDLLSEADKFGLVMSDEEIKNAVNYTDAMTRLDAQITAVKEGFVKELLPQLTAAVDTVTRIIAFFNGRSENGNLSDFFKDEDGQLAKDLITIEGTSSAAMDLVDKLFSMGSAEKMTAEQQKEWKETADWLIKNIPELSGVIDKDTLSITANKDEIEKTIEAWERLAKERAIEAVKEAKLKAMTEANQEGLDKQAQARAKELEIIQKQHEQVAALNALIKDDQGNLTAFGKRFQSEFGTTSVTGDESNFTQMLQLAEHMNSFMLGGANYDNSTLLGIGAELTTLNYQQQSLEKEAESYAEQLKKAQEEYDRWVQGLDYVLGLTEDDAKEAKDEVDKLATSLNNIPDEKRIHVLRDDGSVFYPQAKGNDYVPFDNYPSLLHRGEMVLTASEANRYRNGAGDGADLSGLKQDIVDAIKDGMENATVNTYLDGKNLTDEISRRMAADLATRRFT